MKEPLSEDDCPEDVSIVSFPPFELEKDKINLNFIREENQKIHRLLNSQIKSSENGDNSSEGSDD